MTADITITQALAELQAQLAELSERIARLEHPAPGAAEPVPAAAAEPVVAPTAAPAPAPAQTEVTEEELLAISAALAAYFGVKVRIRQARLISSRAWAQQGRVSIQASHRLGY